MTPDLDSRAGVAGATITTRSGVHFDFAAPDPATIHIEDIAWALAHTCRYGGHTTAFYSVAQHSVLASEIVPAEHALEALLHDAAEAYVGDLVKPLKLLLPEFKAIESRVERAIERRFRLFRGRYLIEGEYWNGYSRAWARESVKRADLVLLKTEQRDLTTARDHVWPGLDHVEPLEQTIVALPPKAAARAFLARFDELAAERDHDAVAALVAEMTAAEAR